MTGILFLDLDGTVRKGFDELGRFVHGPEDVEIFPEVIPLVKWWENEIGPVIGITNQGGIGLGYMTWAQHNAASEETNRQLGYPFSDIYTCPHMPDEGCGCRKPLPALLNKGMGIKEGIEREECLMIGDMESDRICASNAYVPFKWAQNWRTNGF